MLFFFFFSTSLSIICHLLELSNRLNGFGRFFFVLAAKRKLTAYSSSHTAVTERPERHLEKQAWLNEDNLEAPPKKHKDTHARSH